MLMGFSGGRCATMFHISVLSVSSGSTRHFIAKVLPSRPDGTGSLTHQIRMPEQSPSPEDDVSLPCWHAQDTTARGLGPSRGTVLLYWESCSWQCISCLLDQKMTGEGELSYFGDWEMSEDFFALSLILCYRSVVSELACN